MKPEVGQIWTDKWDGTKVEIEEIGEDFVIFGRQLSNGDYYSCSRRLSHFLRIYTCKEVDVKEDLKVLLK